MNLPPEIFYERMRYIHPNADEVREWYALPPSRGVRINTLKLPPERERELGLALEPVPFSPLGRRLTAADIRPGRSPWHHAGAFYMQEPSAMSAVTALDPQPGERVLDMCAAPGGKTTQIAALMQNSGLLIANEYVRSRANALVSNIERLGVRCAVVTSLHPDAIAEALPERFERVLVDAPCSGEGMFRREEAAVTEWSPEHVHTCAVRQRAILESAARCVAGGGVLVYSTCTFSPEENELTVGAFLAAHPDFVLEEIPAAFGRPALDSTALRAYCEAYGLEYIPTDLTAARRILPCDGGEGHFVARLRRPDGEAAPPVEPPQEKPVPDAVGALLDTCLCQVPRGVSIHGDGAYILLCSLRELNGLPPVRAGVLAAVAERGRYEPHHALFMAAKVGECRRVIDLAADSQLLGRFLHGEQIEAPEDMRGFTAVACGGVTVGFGKASGGALKNRYPKGLRIL